MSSIPAIGFVSLGCPKALVDSERILTNLRAEGYLLTQDYFDADLVVINTCGFIDSAIEESLQTIGEAMVENGRVIVTGCLGGDEQRLREEFPDLLAVTGPHAYEAVMQAVHNHVPPPHEPMHQLIPAGGLKLTPRHYAYVKIAEGCNHRCSFCIIPSLRGDLVSRPAGEILREAEALVSAGVRELLVVAQDTAAYGLDLKYQTAFWGGRPVKSRIVDLARGLGDMGVWVRLHYLYPYPVVDQLVELMADGLLVPYLDVPLQHAHERILKEMQRPAHQENARQAIRRWRATCPDLTIRSSFIVGFPGETEAEFQELLDFVAEMELDRVGSFTYSAVEGAAANRIAPHVPEDEKVERQERLMTLQADISAARLKRKVGSEMEVIVDWVTDDDIAARGHGDAPEIDGQVRVAVSTTSAVAPGDVIRVRITDADVHDLWAEQIGD